jgi:hypothetical protein
MIYFSIITPPPNLIAPTIKSRSPLAPHRLNLLTFTTCVACVYFWLVVVFELPVGGNLRQRGFFFDFFISFISPHERKRHPPTHALTTPPSTRHRREQRRRRRRRRRAPAGSGKSPNRPPPRPSPRPNPRPLRFRLVGGHRGVSARRLERGAPQRIPRIKNGDTGVFAVLLSVW